MTKPDIDRLNRLLEEKGGKADALAAKVLLEGVKSEELQKPLRYLVEKRHDYLRPTLISLACEAVGGSPVKALPASVAMILECYYIGLIDNVLDESKAKGFSITLLSRFGIDVALLVSIIIKAKAYHALSQLSGELSHDQYLEVNGVFRDFLVRMVEGEVLNFQVKQSGIVDDGRLLEVFKLEAADKEACTKIGAIIGGGSPVEVESLNEYGKSLGILLLLRDDLRDALNLTVQLADKIRRKSYPYPLLWGINHSQKMRNFLSEVAGKHRITPHEIKRCVSLLFETGAVDHTKVLMDEVATEAVEALKEIGKSAAKKSLRLLAEAQPTAVFRILSE